jgi:hypothetical protein
MKTLLDAVIAAGAGAPEQLECPKSEHALEISSSTMISTDTLVICLKGSLTGGIWSTLSTTTFVAADFVAGGRLVFVTGKLVERVRADITSYESGHSSRGTLTITGTLASGNAVTIGTKVYKFGTTPATAEGSVQIGGTTATSIQNLSLAMTLGAGAGVKYTCAASHPSATICTLAAGTLIVRARTKGEAGDSIVSSATGASLNFGQANLVGGIDCGQVTVNYTPFPNR